MHAVPVLFFLFIIVTYEFFFFWQLNGLLAVIYFSFPFFLPLYISFSSSFFFFLVCGANTLDTGCVRGPRDSPFILYHFFFLNHTLNFGPY